MDVSYYHSPGNCSHMAAQYAHTHVPMVWGAHRTVNIATDAPAVLGYNEPNFHSQANLSPAEAAALWPEIEQQSHGRPLVSPAAAPCKTVSKCIGDSFEWFDEFFRCCNGCRIDYIATHAYHCHGNTTMAYLQQLYDRYGKKIWLTEFACPGSNDVNKQMTYMRELLPQLEAADFVYRYSRL